MGARHGVGATGRPADGGPTAPSSLSTRSAPARPGAPPAPSKARAQALPGAPVLRSRPSLMPIRATRGEGSRIAQRPRVARLVLAPSPRAAQASPATDGCGEQARLVLGWVPEAPSALATRPPVHGSRQLRRQDQARPQGARSLARGPSGDCPACRTGNPASSPGRGASRPPQAGGATDAPPPPAGPGRPFHPAAGPCTASPRACIDMRALVSTMPTLAVRRVTKTAAWSGAEGARRKTWIRFSDSTSISLK